LLPGNLVPCPTEKMRANYLKLAEGYWESNAEQFQKFLKIVAKMTPLKAKTLFKLLVFNQALI
jgi:hypothetical protein